MLALHLLVPTVIRHDWLDSIAPQTQDFIADTIITLPMPSKMLHPLHLLCRMLDMS